MPNIASLAAAWSSSSQEYQAMTGKAAPVEAIKKCWFRSNKTLTLTFQEYDDALEKFEKGRGSPRTPVKVLTADLQTLKKKLDSIKKMAPAHIAELEEEYGEALVNKKNPLPEDDKKLLTRAIKFLKRELESLVSVAESKFASAAYDLQKRGTQTDLLARAAALFEKQMTANIAKGYAMVAKLKTAGSAAAKSPDPAKLAAVVQFYNQTGVGIVQGAGRDINVLTVGLKKFCEKSAPQHLPSVQAFFDFTAPWNSPTAHVLPETATLKQLLEKLSEFTAMLKKAEIFTSRVMKDFL